MTTATYPHNEPAPTLDEVWRLFRENAIQMRETERMLRESSQETDRRFQEAERRSQEAERRSQETDRILRETDRKIAQVSKNIDKLGNRLGEFVEYAVRPAAVRLFQERGIAVHEVHANVSTQRGTEGLEIDLLVVNDTDLIAIECKSHLSKDYVDDHLKRLERIKRLLLAYADKRILGAVAGMVIPAQVAIYAHRQGLFVIGQNGEQLEIRNDSNFKPKAW